MAKKVIHTLFNPDYRENSQFASESDCPYYVAIDTLDSNDPEYPPFEIAIFNHVAEHDKPYDEPRGFVIGPLVWKIEDQESHNLFASMNPTALPAWVEDDGLKFVECNAKGIVLFESNCVFNKIIEDAAWRSSDLLFATGCGLPRSGMRRFLHRLSVQFKIPVFILSDNDLWGYFIFSLMKRGLLAPHAECSYLAVEDCFYLGLRADVDLTSSKEDFVIKWKPYWNIRFEYLMKYACFQKKEWQTELMQFRVNQAGINCHKLLLAVGSKCFFDKYVANSIVEERFLS